MLCLLSIIIEAYGLSYPIHAYLCAVGSLPRGHTSGLGACRMFTRIHVCIYIRIRGHRPVIDIQVSGIDIVCLSTSESEHMYMANQSTLARAQICTLYFFPQETY
eukprot:jgi/Botrbrau1/14065/Bobra.182_3s0012.1